MSSHVATDDEVSAGLTDVPSSRSFCGLSEPGSIPRTSACPHTSRGGSVYAYYADLERGYGQTMSAEVMDAVAHALHLIEEERDHLIRLAQPDRNHTPPVAPPPQRLRPASK